MDCGGQFAPIGVKPYSVLKSVYITEDKWKFASKHDYMFTDGKSYIRYEIFKPK